MKLIANSLIFTALASVLLATNAYAAAVNFIEGAEGQPVTVQFNPSDWSGIPTTGADPENAFFNGRPLGDFGAGSYSIALLEPGSSLNNPIYSDFVEVHWDGPSYFGIDFVSDTEGQGLQLGGAIPDIAVLETGLLQSFVIPVEGDLTVGIQSDVEAANVPEGGSTLLLLGFGWTITAALRRFKK